MTKIYSLSKVLLLILLIITAACKKKSDPAPGGGGGNADALLVIENGGLRVVPNAQIPYSALILTPTGPVAATNVTWKTGNDEIATFSGSMLTGKNSGTTTVTAEVNYGGSKLTSTVPLVVSTPSLFTVLPSAVIYEAGHTLQLETIYLGTASSVTYEYQSNKSDVVSVNSSGLLTFHAAGEAVITVEAKGLEGNPKVQIPVVVIGKPVVELPVARIEVTPTTYDLFKGETKQFVAKAFNSKGEDVTSNVSIVWTVQYDSVASVSNSGLVTGKWYGETKIKATSHGVTGEATIQVIPKRIIEISPYYTSMEKGAEKTFTAKTYQVNKLGSGQFSFTEITNASTLKWEIPSFGMSMFDVATIQSSNSTSATVKMKSDAMAGFMATLMALVPADDETAPGLSVIMVSNCDCGTTAATAVNTNQNSYTVNMMGGTPTQISATTTPSGQAVKYCVEDQTIANVSEDGTIMAGQPGTTKVKVCSGNASKEVTITVQEGGFNPFPRKN
ncbi:MAG: Ig-like domain-containing protein [Cytophagaceae bacterium]